IHFKSANGTVFQVKKYADALDDVIDRKQIRADYNKDLIKIDGPNKKAVFKDLNSGDEETVDYDMIHVVPYMSAPDFIKEVLCPMLMDGSTWIPIPSSITNTRMFSALEMFQVRPLRKQVQRFASRHR